MSVGDDECVFLLVGSCVVLAREGERVRTALWFLVLEWPVPVAGVENRYR